MNKHKTLLKFVAILITVLFGAVIMLAAIGLTEGGTSFPSDITVTEAPIKYSSATTERFYKAFRLFFLTENVENPMFEWLIHDAYKAFSSARIPTEKMLWFVDKLEKIKADENPMYLYLQEKTEQYDKLQKQYEEDVLAGLNPKKPTYHDVFTAAEMQKGMKETFFFILSSPLTNDEMGRLFYQSALSLSGDTDYAKLLRQVGEKDISMLTVGSYMVFRSASDLSTTSSLVAARATGQSLVALGSSYLSLIKKVGLSNIDRLFGLDYRIAENESEGIVTGELIPYYNEQLDILSGFAGGSLLLTGHILEALPQAMFEELYLSNRFLKEGKQSEARAHKIVAAAKLSVAIRDGLNAAKQNSEKLYLTDGEAVAMLSKAYVANFRMTDILDGNMESLKNTATYENYYRQAESKLKNTLIAADSLKGHATNDRFYQWLLDAEKSDPSAYQKCAMAAETVLDFDFAETDGVTNLLTGLLFNVFVRFLTAK